MLEYTNKEEIEKQHQDGISRLIELYGIEREKEIRKCYEDYRSDLEKHATIFDHIPQFAYQHVRKVLGKPPKKHRSVPQAQNQPEEPKQHTKRSKLLGMLRL